MEVSEEIKVEGKINDGHVHLHYPREVPDSEILGEMDRVDEIKKEYNIDRIAGVFLPNNYDVIDEIIEEHDYIFPGMYVLLGKYSDQEKRKNLFRRVKDKCKFFKINHQWIEPFLMRDTLEEVIEDSVSLGVKKFQIHSSRMDNKALNILRKPIEEHGAIFYISHGLNTTYSQNKPDMNEIKDLEGNLLLGTSPKSWVLEIPNPQVKEAIEDGIWDMVAFGSDLTFNHKNKQYSSSIDSITRAVEGRRKVLKKIMHDNLELFLE